MNQYASKYSPVQQMAASTARMIRDGEVAIIGIGLPLIAAAIARAEHAPNSTILFEGGGIGARSNRMPWSIADTPCTDNAIACMEVWRILSDMQAGYIDVGIIGGAQVDRFGNLNSTAIFGDGSYFNPHVRMPGSGGSNDIASSCGRTIIMMRLRKNNFVRQVDYVTSPGYLQGFDSRERIGLRGGGPAAVITEKGLFRFDPQTKEMYLHEVAENSKVEEISELVDWDLKIASDLRTMEPPTCSQIELMKQIDPLGAIIGTKGSLNMDCFSEYARVMERLL